MCNILNNLGIDHILENVEADGNCFYHAVSKQLNEYLNWTELRFIVAKNLNADDLSLFNTINNVSISLHDLKKLVLEDGTLWADSIEIHVLSRALNIGIFIFNEEWNIVNKIKANKSNKFIFLMRENMHFQSLKISTTNQKRIEKLLRKTDNLTLTGNKHDFDICLTISILVPLSFMLFQFFNRTL